MSGATKSRELNEDLWLHEEEKNSENNNAGLLVLGRDGFTTGNFVNLSICEQSHRVRHIGERAVTKNHPQLSHARVCHYTCISIVTLLTYQSQSIYACMSYRCIVVKHILTNPHATHAVLSLGTETYVFCQLTCTMYNVQ